MSDGQIDALCKAVQRGNVEKIRELLAEGVAVNGKDRIGMTPLMHAAQKGHVESVKILLAAGADPHIKAMGDTVLRLIKDHIAIAKMDDSTAKLIPKLKEIETLLKNAPAVPQAKPAEKTEKAPGRHQQAAANASSQADVALNAKAKALRKAATRGDAEKVRQALKDGAPLETLNENKWTPIMLAAQGGHAEVFRILVDAGANLQHRGLSDTDLIGCAAEGGNVEILQFLLKTGHPVEGYWNPRSREEKRMGNFTPLMNAALNGHLDAVRVLLAAGADRDAKFDGETTLKRVQQNIKFPHGEKEVALVPRLKAIAELLQGRAASSKSEEDEFVREVEAFTTNAARPEYSHLLQLLNSECGKGKPWQPVADHGLEAAKVLSFTLKHCKNEQQLESLQKAAREAGCHLVLAEPWVPGESAKWTLFPTSNPYAVVAACGTEGANHSVNTQDIIAWLRQVEMQNPFDLTLCNHESVGCHFHGQVKSASKLAKSMAEICPSVLDELDDAATLANCIKKERSIYLRWD